MKFLFWLILAAWAWTCRGDVTLSWNDAPGADGYNVYYGTASRSYSSTVSAGSTNQVTITGLDPNTTYFFAVTCVVGGLESGYSDEIVFKPSPGPPAVQLTAGPGGQQILHGAAPSGHLYDVLASSDLVVWQAIGNVTIGADGSFSFADPDASWYPARFYRLHETTYTAPGSLPNLQLLAASPVPGQLLISGQLGHVYEVLASQDLSAWIMIGKVTAGPQGSVGFTDPAASQYPARFYLLHEVTYLSAAPSYQLALGLDGTLELQISGLSGHTYDVLGTPDLLTWSVLGQVTVGMGGSANFSAPADAGFFLLYSVREATGP